MNKSTILVFVYMLPLFAFGQAHYDWKRFIDDKYFKDEDISECDTVIYGKAKDWEGNNTILNMTVTGPDTSRDMNKIRPLIMLIHGGYFYFGNKKAFDRLAMLLAERGFVVASINYRTGWNFDPFFKKKTDKTYYAAVCNAVQDSKAALRYLVHNSARFGIDTSWIFVGGISAGAVTAIYMKYYNRAAWNNESPWLMSKTAKLDSSSNRLKDKYTIKGVISISGGIGDTANMSKREVRNTPILIFHGTNDTVIPYTNVDTVKRPNAIRNQGGYLMAQRFRHLDGCYKLNTSIGGGHVGAFPDKFLAHEIGIFCKNVMTGNCASAEAQITDPKKAGNKH